MEKTKVIQVGIGGMGNAWLKAVLDSKEVEFAGFVEINERIAKEQAQKYGLNKKIIFKSLPEALKRVKTDGVIDVTPPQFHEEISLTSLEAGVPVLSEKPLSSTLESAKRIVEKSTETGVLHMVAQNYRYNVPAQTLKKALNGQKLGKPGAVTLEFFKGPHFGGFREKMPYPLIIDMSIHHYDAMRFLFESDPLTIYGKSWNPCWSWFAGDASAVVIIEFPHGLFVSYNASWCSTGKETTWTGDWRIECEKGVVVLEDDEIWLSPTQGEVEKMKDLKPPYITQAYLLHEFHLALTKGITPATTCQDNLKSLAMVFDTIKSFETGAVVKCNG